MAGLTHRTAWRAAAIEARGARVKPAFNVFTPPVTIDAVSLFRTVLSAPISGTAQPGALVVLSVAGALIRGVADLGGAWAITVPVDDVGAWPIDVWQVTQRGIHAPATSTLIVHPTGAMPELDFGGIYRTTMTPVVVTGDGIAGAEVEIEVREVDA